MLCRCFSVNRLAFAFLLLATRCLSLLFLFFAVAFAFLCSAPPLLIKATPCIHSLHDALLLNAFVLRCASLLCHCIACQFSALPLRHVSKSCRSHAVISNSELCCCGANHVVSMQFHCVSVQSFALPLIRGSKPHFAIASPFVEKLCLCT